VTAFTRIVEGFPRVVPSALGPWYREDYVVPNLVFRKPPPTSTLKFVHYKSLLIMDTSLIIINIEMYTRSRETTARETIDLWPELATVLGISRNAVYDAARRGDFRTIRIGKRILVPRAELDRLLTGKTPV
jgi:excisionase family DNA binding protein